MLLQAVPEFAASIREHRKRFPDQALLYELLAPLFDFVVQTFRQDPNVARRTFSLVETIMMRASKDVKDAFAIELLEPLAEDADHTFYPNLEPLMGPTTKQEFAGMRTWFNEYGERNRGGSTSS